MNTKLTELPQNLPQPIDDGGAQHLQSIHFPVLELLSTNGTLFSIGEFQRGMHILFCYPMTGQPGTELPEGWDMIPGARGCTPECLGFASTYKELLRLGFTLWGVSTQEQTYQQELVTRLSLPFEILSDADLLLANILTLPTFNVEGKTLLKRLTLIINDGIIIKVFYPVFPPDKHPLEVLTWAKSFQLNSTF